MKKSVIYKFILFRIKELVCDDSSRPRFMISFDRIIEDLFGVPKFSRKISNFYDNRDICAIVDLVGIENLLKIFDNNYYYAIMSELIMVDFQIRATCKTLDKKKKSEGKQRKTLLKKKNYLVDLYRKSIKHLKKLLGIKNAETAYKRNFQVLNGLVNKRDYDDEWGFDLDYDIDDPYDTEYSFGSFGDRFDDEYESTSPLEDFVRQMNGNPVRREEYHPGGRRNRRKASLSDSDFDPYDDYDPKYANHESVDDEEEETYSDAKIDRLSETVMDLASVVNALVNQKEHEVANPVNHKKSLSDIYDEEDLEESSNNLSGVEDALNKINEDQKLIAGALGNLIHWRDDVDNVLQALLNMEDEEDVEEEENFEDEPEVEYKKAEILPPEESRESMIDQINHRTVPIAGAPIE